MKPITVFGSLQSCRGFAAVLVVLFHATVAISSPKYLGALPLGGLFSFGHAGVEFFFVLSGFIIVTAHFGDIGRPAALGSYLRKRALRIYPVYWVLYLVLGVAMLSIPGLTAGAPLGPMSALAGFLLLPQDKAITGGTGAPIIVAAWSLHYEVLFYLLFGCFIASRKLGAAAASTVALLVVASWGSTSFPASFLGNPFPFLFAMGAVVAVLARRDAGGPQPLLWAVTGVVLFGLTAAAELYGDGSPTLGWGYGTGSAMMVLGLVSAERADRVDWLKAAWLQLLGDASYSIYLVHYPVISIVCKALVKVPGVGPNLGFAFAVAAGVVAGVALHLGVEKPLLHHLNRRRATALAYK